MATTQETGSIKFSDTPVKTKLQQEAVPTKSITSNKWEIKDRIYYLKGDDSPISYTIQSKNIMWFDFCTFNTLDSDIFNICL